MMNAVSANSHLCSFVLTQFSLTHSLAQHIDILHGGIILEILFVNASGVERAPLQHHPPLSGRQHPLALFVLCDVINVYISPSGREIVCFNQVSE